MVRSIAARNASSDPMSLTATLGVEVACVLLVISWWAPDADRDEWCARRTQAVNARDLPGHVAAWGTPRRPHNHTARFRGPSGGDKTARGHSAEFRVCSSRW